MPRKLTKVDKKLFIFKSFHKQLYYQILIKNYFVNKWKLEILVTKRKPQILKIDVVHVIYIEYLTNICWQLRLRLKVH